jgi:hypothetical protein
MEVGAAPVRVRESSNVLDLRQELPEGSIICTCRRKGVRQQEPDREPTGLNNVEDLMGSKDGMSDRIG